MLKIELSPVEVTILIQILETSLSDLRSEIVGTDNITYKEMLRQRKTIILRLLAHLNEKQQLPLAD